VQAKEILHGVQKDWYEEHVHDEGRKEIGFLTTQGNDTVMEDGKEKTMEYYSMRDKSAKYSLSQQKQFQLLGESGRNYQKDGGV
jgi:hypothetical protein